MIKLSFEQRWFSKEEKEFINEHVNLRLGRFANSKVRPLAQLAEKIDPAQLVKVSRKSLCLFRKTKKIDDIIYQPSLNERNSQFISSMKCSLGSDSSKYFIDFADSIPDKYDPFQKIGVPVFSKNRPKGSDSPILLWTHQSYRKNRERGISGAFGRIEWHEKIAEPVWRGSPHGSILLSDGSHVPSISIFKAISGEAKRIHRLLQKDYGTQNFREIAYRNMARFRLVIDFQEKYNVRFTPLKGDRAISYMKFLKEREFLFGSRLSQIEMSKFKYMIVLGGNDAGSQLHWALSSNSVLLMPPIRFHSTTSLGLEKWVHYIPIKNDFSDLEDTIDWCKANDEECRQIAANAFSYVMKFQPHVEEAINRRIMEIYNYSSDYSWGRKVYQFLVGDR